MSASGATQSFERAAGDFFPKRDFGWVAPLNQKTLVGEVGKGGKAGTLAEIRMQKLGACVRACAGVFFFVSFGPLGFGVPQPITA